MTTVINILQREVDSLIGELWELETESGYELALGYEQKLTEITENVWDQSDLCHDLEWMRDALKKDLAPTL